MDQIIREPADVPIPGRVDIRAPTEISPRQDKYFNPKKIARIGAIYSKVDPVQNDRVPTAAKDFLVWRRSMNEQKRRGY